MTDVGERGPSTAAVFDRAQESWRAWQESPWGRLRYALVARLLDRHLPAPAAAGEPPVVVLDVGGGDGADSVRLAGPGRAVVVADASSAMLERAVGRVHEAGVDVRTTAADLAVLADDAVVREEAPDGADVVLCHHVLQYCDDLDTAVGQVLAVARPGALVSVMVSNPVVHVLAAAVRDLDPEAALALLDAETKRTATFDHAMRRITWQDGVAALERAGCTVEARYGVLCVNHLVVDDERKHDPQFAAALGRLELELADRDPYRDVAAMWLVVARR
ncbi:class I SAM-dependent methyltransferase [Angustibacter peucedani]